MNIYFWFAAGMLTGLAIAFVLVPLRRVLLPALKFRPLRHGLAAVAIVAIGALVTFAYRSLGRPDLLEPQTATAELAHAGARMPTPGDPAESLESAATRLEERITREGGSREDWQLLAQSYDFLGRPDDAARARARADGAPASKSDGQATMGTEGRIAEYVRRTRENPGDADAWLTLANLHRQQRAFEQARAAFAKVIELKAMSADAWADYADVLASLSGGSLAGEAARAIDRALSINGEHVKALWLKASLAHEQQRYRDALPLWMKLRAVLPPESSDVRIVDANIAEAAELAKLPPMQAANVTREAPVEVSGTISIDQKLAGRVPAGATLFIYAKAADSSGPPLAVLRMTAGAWPVSFRLDDTLAMIPERRLSSFDKVVVEARISRSGQATRAPGDLYTVSPVLRPAEGKKLALVISREVG